MFETLFPAAKAPSPLCRAYPLCHSENFVAEAQNVAETENFFAVRQMKVRNLIPLFSQTKEIPRSHICSLGMTVKSLRRNNSKVAPPKMTKKLYVRSKWQRPLFCSAQNDRSTLLPLICLMIKNDIRQKRRKTLFRRFS